MVGSGMIGRGPRDRLIGTQVMVTKGPSKGVAGVIKDTNGNLARVELLTGNKVISIDKSKLKWRKYVACARISGFEAHRVSFPGRMEPLKAWIADQLAETCDRLRSTLTQSQERLPGKLPPGREVRRPTFRTQRLPLGKLPPERQILTWMVERPLRGTFRRERQIPTPMAERHQPGTLLPGHRTHTPAEVGVEVRGIVEEAGEVGAVTTGEVSRPEGRTTIQTTGRRTHG